MLLLNPKQVAEFEKVFSQNKLNIQEPIFQSWLVLKLASIPSESEALTSILESHTAKNISKRKKPRKENLPIGPARYDPASQEWVSILEEQNKRSCFDKTK